MYCRWCHVVVSGKVPRQLIATFQRGVEGDRIVLRINELFQGNQLPVALPLCPDFLYELFPRAPFTPGVLVLFGSQLEPLLLNLL